MVFKATFSSIFKLLFANFSISVTDYCFLSNCGFILELTVSKLSFAGTTSKFRDFLVVGSVFTVT